MNKQDVIDRLKSAKYRLSELLDLNRGDLACANSFERQRLVQEYFFHLVGAIDVLSQFVNEQKTLSIDYENVSITAVLKKLPTDDPLKNTLNALYTPVRGTQVPSDPYTEDAYIFRAYNYRHQVTHRGTNPFLFRVGSLPRASLMIDPRDVLHGHSIKSVQEEMQSMLRIVQERCNAVLVLI